DHVVPRPATHRVDPAAARTARDGTGRVLEVGHALHSRGTRGRGPCHRAPIARARPVAGYLNGICSPGPARPLERTGGSPIYRFFAAIRSTRSSTLVRSAARDGK